MTRHIHKAVESMTKTFGFNHCVAPHDCNPVAHGGVCRVETCQCGAERRTNSTGPGREEIGPWELLTRFYSSMEEVIMTKGNTVYLISSPGFDGKRKDHYEILPCVPPGFVECEYDPTIHIPADLVDDDEPPEVTDDDARRGDYSIF